MYGLVTLASPCYIADNTERLGKNDENRSKMIVKQMKDMSLHQWQIKIVRQSCLDSGLVSQLYLLTLHRNVAAAVCAFETADVFFSAATSSPVFDI